jgi:hypothetical protein
MGDEFFVAIVKSSLIILSTIGLVLSFAWIAAKNWLSGMPGFLNRPAEPRSTAERPNEKHAYS